MSLLLTMLPFYIFGNLHCLGMCGPLVMMISKHRYRYFYFLGRLTSFSLAGMIAGEVGAVLNFTLKEYYVQPIICSLFGIVVLSLGVCQLFHIKFPKSLNFNASIFKKFLAIDRYLSTLLLRDLAFPTFLFGLFTVLLPCGQTLLVFSACALSGSIVVGLINGFFFALLTSPSLFFAMSAYSFLYRYKKYYQPLIGISAIFIALITICRAMAEMELMDHFVLNLGNHEMLHIVLY